MSSNLVSFALPESMRDYVDQRLRSGQYGNTSDYLRELIRRDQEEQARKCLRELIEDGMNPGQAPAPQCAARARHARDSRARSRDRGPGVSPVSPCSGCTSRPKITSMSCAWSAIGRTSSPP
jgi:antitoxin ParD1/3/4